MRHTPILLFLPLVAAACSDRETPPELGAATCVDGSSDAIVPDSLCVNADTSALGARSGGAYVGPWIWYYGGMRMAGAGGAMYMRGGTLAPNPAVTYRSSTGLYSRPATVRGGFGGTASGRSMNS